MAGKSQPAKMLNWPRAFLAVQTSVSAAGDDLARVLQVVLDNALDLVAAADGGEIELLRNGELECCAASGMATKPVGARTAAIRALPGFCSISARRQQAHADAAGRASEAERVLRTSIIAPIPFEGEHVGVMKLHSRTAQAFDDADLLALQLLAGLIAQGLARDAHSRGERARAQADRRFAATFEQAAVGIAHVAPDGSFIRVNDRFCEIAGHDREALLDGGFQRITHPEDVDADLAHVDDLLHGRSSSYSMEKRYVRADGVIVWVNLTASLIRKPDGSPDFFVSVIEDISARREAQLDAELDPLTGMLNRRGALRRLNDLMDGSGPLQRGMAVAFLDLDGFKAVNDRFGHNEGDRCLTKVAAALRKSLRSDDMIARLGGDEFLVIFPADTEMGVADVLDRLQRNIDAVSDGEPWDTSVSVGVIVVPADAHADAEAVIVAADNLMYRAKHSGSTSPVVATLSAAA